MSLDGIPDSVIEFMFARKYGWNIEYVRNLAYSDYLRHAFILLSEFIFDSAHIKAVQQSSAINPLASLSGNKRK